MIEARYLVVVIVVVAAALLLSSLLPFVPTTLMTPVSCFYAVIQVKSSSSPCVEPSAVISREKSMDAVAAVCLSPLLPPLFSPATGPSL
jgi:hypothetical protein